jgi:hypothetical protein
MKPKAITGPKAIIGPKEITVFKPTQPRERRPLKKLYTN